MFGTVGETVASRIMITRNNGLLNEFCGCCCCSGEMSCFSVGWCYFSTDSVPVDWFSFLDDCCKWVVLVLVSVFLGGFEGVAFPGSADSVGLIGITVKDIRLTRGEIFLLFQNIEAPHQFIVWKCRVSFERMGQIVPVSFMACHETRSVIF